MVRKKMLTRSSLLGALCLPVLPGFAQDTGGLEMTFGIEQGLDWGRNVALDVPAGGDRTTAFNALSFGISSETGVDRLNLEADSLFRVQSLDGDVSNEFTSPELVLSYTRVGANAEFSVSANYQQREIDDLRSLSEFINEDGVVELPTDFDDLTGTGRRTEYGARANLNLGVNDPLGFELTLGTSSTNYEDATSADLFDTERADIGILTRLEMTPTLTGTVRLSYDTFNAEDGDQTERNTTNLSFGMIYDLSPRSTLEASIGQSWIDTVESGVATDTSDIIGSLGLSYAMPNGTLAARYDSSRDVDGTGRQSVLVTRSLELPAGRLSASVGASQPADDDVEMIGSIDWFQEMPTGQFTARIDHSVSVDSDDETRMTTLANMSVGYDINRVSALNLGLTYVVAEGTAAANRVEQTDISASYRHELTRDWNLNTGVNYRIRDEETVGEADSPVVYISLGREFTVRP